MKQGQAMDATSLQYQRAYLTAHCQRHSAATATERAAAVQPVWCLRSTQGSQYTARKWPLQIPDVAADSGFSPVSLFWARCSTVRLDRPRQAYARIVPVITETGRQPPCSMNRSGPPQPEQAYNARLCKTLQQQALSSALSLAVRRVTFKAIVAKVQLVDSCKWAEELERPAGAKTRQVYRRDPPLCAGDAGPGGIISGIAKQPRATGFVAQPQKRAGVGCAAWCLRRDMLGAQHIADALRPPYFNANKSP